MARAGVPNSVAGPAVTATPTRRRLAVHRRALRRELSRLHDRRRIIAMTLLIITFGLIAAGVVARGEPAGADARAYWAGVRIWLGGGDPYHPTGPFLPYVYAPWMLPVFAPWALLPWDVAWFVWRGGTIFLCSGPSTGRTASGRSRPRSSSCCWASRSGRTSTPATSTCC